MSRTTKIEWCEATMNLWHGCTKVHAGCDHCYAETMTKRWGRDIWGPGAPRMEIKSVWGDLKNQQKAAKAAGTFSRVFVGSMMDIFEKPMPVVDSHGIPAIDQSDDSPINTGYLRQILFNQIDQGAYPNLIFLFLTKRPSNINKMIPRSWATEPPGNVMFGTSPSDQATAATLIPQLLAVNGKRFLSCEPLLGPIDFFKIKEAHPNDIRQGINWIIAGGESGAEARPMHPEWPKKIRGQADLLEIPFFFKQWGEYGWLLKDREKAICVRNDGKVFKKTDPECNQDCWMMQKVGKKAAGRELDGQTYSEFPWELFKKQPA